MPPVANPNPDRARRGAAAPAPDERALTVRNESSDSDNDSAAIVAAQRAVRTTTGGPIVAPAPARVAPVFGHSALRATGLEQNSTLRKRTASVQ